VILVASVGYSFSTRVLRSLVVNPNKRRIISGVINAWRVLGS